MVTLRYYGHSAFGVEHDDSFILIDPYLTGNSHTNLTPSSFDRVTAIIITHGHRDHIGDAVEIAKQTGALVISNFEIANWIKARGCNAHAMHIGGGHQFTFGQVKLTIAHHGSSGPDGEYLGAPAGVVLTIGGKKIYHAGDTGLFYDMKLIGKHGGPIDVALLPIGDNFTMGIDDAVVAAELINATLTIPMHYNTFPIITADPQEFLTKLLEKDQNGAVIRFDDSITLT